MIGAIARSLIFNYFPFHFEPPFRKSCVRACNITDLHEKWERLHSRGPPYVRTHRCARIHGPWQEWAEIWSIMGVHKLKWSSVGGKCYTLSRLQRLRKLRSACLTDYVHVIARLGITTNQWAFIIRLVSVVVPEDGVDQPSTGQSSVDTTRRYCSIDVGSIHHETLTCRTNMLICQY